ncbi:hypothetical protein [Promicromonospora sp. NPDC050262]|uniref:hypothetical protein n=1 Tax=Promicromonospora sp. NPDC050262 TaxID=3155036 RepID=UPI0033EE9416
MEEVQEQHLPDLIHFAEDLRVTLQEIGTAARPCSNDDVCTTAYLYHVLPHVPFPALRPVLDRRPL